MNKYLEHVKLLTRLHKISLSEEEIKSIAQHYTNFCGKIAEISSDIEFFGKVYGAKRIYYYARNRKPEIRFIEYDRSKEDKEHFKISGRMLFFDPDSDDAKMISAFSSSIRNEESFNHPNHVRNHIIKHLESAYLNKDEIDSVFYLLKEDKREIELEHHDFLGKVLLVIEKDNKRYCLSSRSNYSNFHFDAVSLSDEKYNYMDEGRHFYNNIYFDEVEIKELDKEIAQYIDRHTHGLTVINQARLKLFKQKKNDEECLEKAKEQYSQKLINRLSEGIVYNDVKFNKHFVEYGPFKFGSEDADISGFIEQYVDFEKDIDINMLYERFCDFAAGLPASKISITAGKFEIMLEKRQSNKSASYFVEGIRINKSEIQEVLKRTLCFNSKLEYIFFLKNVSQCSIRFHQFLANGVKIPFQEGDERKFVRLRIKRKGNRNYIALSTKRFRIKNSNELFAKENAHNTLESITIFLMENLEITADEVIELIESGLKDYEEIVKKSEEFLSDAITTVDAKPHSETFNDALYEGYLVKGKVNTYFVDSRDLKVYRYPGFKYVCIVDTDLDSNIKNDRLAARLYCVANDDVLAGQVHTLAKA